MNNVSLASSRTTNGRSLLWLGLAVTVLAIAAYVVQVSFARLSSPLYVPIAATIGVALVIAALMKQRSFWRWTALVFIVFLAGAEWFFVIGTRLPNYSGPVAVGQSFPAFSAMTANGKPFTQHEL